MDKASFQLNICGPLNITAGGANGTKIGGGGGGVLNINYGDGTLTGPFCLFYGGTDAIHKGTSDGDFTFFVGAKGIVLWNGAKTKQSRIRLNDAGDGIVVDAIVT